MDWTQIIVALITVIGATIGTLLVNIREKNRDRTERIKAENKIKADKEAKEQAQSEQLEKFKEDIIKTLKDHRKEYIEGINEVQDTISEIKSEYKSTVTAVSMQIKNLEEKQDKHNSIIERTYKLETDVKVLQALQNTEGKL